MRSRREQAHDLGRAAAEQVARIASAGTPRSGRRDVVLAPAAAGALLHELVGHALEADLALAGSAVWRRRGTRLAPATLTIADDGTDPRAWERHRVDEEGTPVRRTELVDRGVVVGVLADRETARSLGVPAGGNGRRGSYQRQPAPRSRHLVVAAGPVRAADVIAATDGLLVHSLDACEVDVRTGSFSLRVLEAQELVAGQPGRWLSGFSVNGDLAALGRIDAVADDVRDGRTFCGRDGRWLPVSWSSPSIAVAGLEVVGR